MRNVAYIKASHDRTEIEKQRKVILDFAKSEQISISRFIEIPIAKISAKNQSKRHRLLHHVSSGDTLIVSQLSDMGWSLSEIVKTVDILLNMSVRFIAIKDGIDLNGEEAIESKVITKMFAILADIGHQLVSKHTKEALAIAKQRGRVGGRRSALNPTQQQFAVRLYQESHHSVNHICTMVGISKPTLYGYIKKADVPLRSHDNNRV